jgi:cystathionine beta-lyase/cystathionine gamma-synthase
VQRAEAGISDGVLRIAPGLVDGDVLIRDLERGLLGARG